MLTLTETQRAVLRAVVDTVVPSLDRPDDPTGFWRTPGSATGADAALELALITLTPEDRVPGLLQLLDAMAALGLPHQPLAVREVILRTVGGINDEAFVAVATLRGTAALLSYALTDEQRRNPFWPQLGYPGPQVEPPDTPPAITPYVPTGGEVLRADAVVVGSGAGGGTVAGVLAAGGLDVVVLEAGAYHSERDFVQTEAWAGPALMWRAGLGTTADDNVLLLAGATLGGGTTVNWQNCVRPSDRVRAEWARLGVEGADTPEFDRHLGAVLARMGASDACADLNGPHRRMVEGAEALGWSWHRATLNVDPARHDARLAGYTQFGDVTGAKQGTVATYLQDAHDAGARIVVHAKAQRVLTRDGRAYGVEVVVTDPAAGTTRTVTVEAPHVVVAGGALETPALLLRSGIGGPAVGRHLRLHPSNGMFGEYAEDQQAWWGPPQAAVMDEFRDVDDGYGFLVEGSQYYTGLFAFQLNVSKTGVESKETMARLSRMSDLLFILRERGSGAVTLGPDGEAVVTYAMTDERDLRLFHQGLAALARLHEAAGAQRIHTTAVGVPAWERGEDLDAWIARVQAVPVRAGGVVLGSAHQMGTARIGTDPADSVAGPTGELHDTPGVWVGDTSAFPTPSGANPMLTCMALAHRTAEHVLAAAGRTTAGASA